MKRLYWVAVDYLKGESRQTQGQYIMASSKQQAIKDAITLLCNTQPVEPKDIISIYVELDND